MHSYVYAYVYVPLYRYNKGNLIYPQVKNFKLGKNWVNINPKKGLKVEELGGGGRVNI
jgi:hypothetical protein